VNYLLWLMGCLMAKRNSLGRLSADGELRSLEVTALVKDLDNEIEELERTVVYWQTLFEESQKEASNLRTRNRELEAQLQSAYSDAEDRPRYFEENEVTKASVANGSGNQANRGWTFFGSVSQLVNRSN